MHAYENLEGIYQHCTEMQAMIGGEWFEELFGNPDEMSEDALAKVAIQELKDHLGMAEKPKITFSKVQKVIFPISCFSVSIIIGCTLQDPGYRT